ncbi:MAG TPA: phosphatidate cytidylyltransferase [Blastocatellia bacterium]|nr:phosphatidate cytidylyltransferase [Blastocatellia bacterium]
MVTRIISGLILFAVLVFTLWSANPLYFIGLAVVAIALGMHEYYSLAARVGLRCQRWLAFCAGAAIIVGFYYSRIDLIVAALVAVTIIALIAGLFHPENFESSLSSTAATLFGVIYVPLLTSFAIAIKLFDSQGERLGSKLLGLFFLIIIASDTGAYFTGRAIGRHKLAPKISPGKTIEGVIGGLGLSFVAAIISKKLFFAQIPWAHLIILTAILVPVGILGDLSESMLKRGANAKDAASIIPGHGGILDRMDSLLFNAPIIYYYYVLFLKS